MCAIRNRLLVTQHLPGTYILTPKSIQLVASISNEEIRSTFLSLPKCIYKRTHTHTLHTIISDNGGQQHKFHFALECIVWQMPHSLLIKFDLGKEQNEIVFSTHQLKATLTLSLEYRWLKIKSNTYKNWPLKTDLGLLLLIKFKTGKNCYTKCVQMGTERHVKECP